MVGGIPRGNVVRLEQDTERIDDLHVHRFGHPSTLLETITTTKQLMVNVHMISTLFIFL